MYRPKLWENGSQVLVYSHVLTFVHSPFVPHLGFIVMFNEKQHTAGPQTETLCAAVPGILLRVLEVFREESKVFAQF